VLLNKEANKTLLPSSIQNVDEDWWICGIEILLLLVFLFS